MSPSATSKSCAKARVVWPQESRAFRTGEPFGGLGNIEILPLVGSQAGSKPASTQGIERQPCGGAIGRPAFRSPCNAARQPWGETFSEYLFAMRRHDIVGELFAAMLAMDATTRNNPGSKFLAHNWRCSCSIVPPHGAESSSFFAKQYGIVMEDLFSYGEPTGLNIPI